jgi:protein required for attachment to host cells
VQTDSATLKAKRWIYVADVEKCVRFSNKGERHTAKQY